MKIFKSSLLIVIISFLFVASIAYFVSIEFLDRNANDYVIKQMTYNKKPSGDDNIVLVIIDDKSIEAIRWPWSRSLYTEIFDYLKHSGAKAILFDAVITSPDSYNPQGDKLFYSKLKEYTNLTAGYNLFSTNNNSGDILPQEYDAIFQSKSNVNIRDKRLTKIKSDFKGIIKFPKEYIQNVPSLGSVMIPMDSDGVIRSYMPVVEYKDILYPSLALSGFAIATGIKDFVLYDGLLCSADNCKSLRIPITERNASNSVYSSPAGVYANFNWYKPINEYYSHRVYPAIDVLNSQKAFKKGGKPLIPQDDFKNKIVIVGGNAASQSLEDRRNTPVLLKHSGVDIQATALSNMLDNKFFIEKNPVISLIITVLFAILTFLIIKRFSIFASLGINLILIISHLFFYNLLMINNIEISLFAPILILLVVITFGYTYRYIIEGQSKEKLKNIMGKYISKDIMQNVVDNIDHIKLGGIKSEVTILFADIRGFTSISENLSAEEVTVILNEYFSVIEPVIRKYDGVINKFMGDAILAIFGEPIKNKKHAVNAVKCAHEILKKIKPLQAKWLMEGKPKISIGIGINTGEAFVGNIGTEERLEYTVIGDTVNLANRIEAHNRIYKTKFLISENTYKHITDIADVIKISDVTIRGKAKKINIYEVLRITE